MQEFTVPKAGTYKLEVWGAQGGGGGYGGYSYGTLKMELGHLYICTGGCNGYNGGKPTIILDSYNKAGGATHIALTNKDELKNYESYKDEVLIVAGGGGSAEWSGAVGGSGGGNAGGESNYNVNLDNNGSYQLQVATGGTQTTGGKTADINMDGGVKVNGSFGQGGYGYIGTDAGGCGGGGWYGGGGCVYVGGGGGGSGHINTNYITNGNMQNGVRSGDGYAKITQISF